MIRRLALAVFAAALAALAFGQPARADWKDMNEAINATNFIVADQCSGTLISIKYRLVLTNNHCLEGYVSVEEKEEVGPGGEVRKVSREVFKDMTLTQKSYQGFERVGSATYQARVVAHKKEFDLALLRIRADSIPQKIYSHILPDGKTVTRGDAVFVVGNPLMLDANLNKGIVSSTTRMLHPDWTDADTPFIQVDAGVNPGNSGGALYDADGELIGVPAASARGTGLGLAIPYTLVRKFLDDICYNDVWNDKAAGDHDACEKAKLDRENEIRAKAGLPPKDAPKADGFEGAAEPFKADALILRPAPRSALLSNTLAGVSALRERLSAFTASGARFRPLGLSAAHRTLPFGSRLRVCFSACAVVVVNDRGPAGWTGRSLDLSLGAARAVGLTRVGVAAVKVERVE